MFSTEQWISTVFPRWRFFHSDLYPLLQERIKKRKEKKKNSLDDFKSTGTGNFFFLSFESHCHFYPRLSFLSLCRILTASCSCLPSPPPPFSLFPSSRWSVLLLPTSSLLSFFFFFLSFSPSSLVLSQSWVILLRLSLSPGNFHLAFRCRASILMSQTWRSSRCRG